MTDRQADNGAIDGKYIVMCLTLNGNVNLNFLFDRPFSKTTYIASETSSVSQPHVEIQRIIVFILFFDLKKLSEKKNE